jgi:hypothetical protein
MPVGIYIEGKTPEEVKKSDWKHYVINVGETFTKYEVLTEVSESGMGIDSWAFEKQKRLLPSGWYE